MAGQNRSSDVIGVCATMVALLLIAIALRIYSRLSHKTNSRIGWDDWTAVAALPAIIAQNCMMFYWTTLGFGQHVSDAPGSAEQIAKVLFIQNFFYDTGLSLVKLSVVLFYAKVCWHIRWFMVLLWITSALIGAWYITFICLAILGCLPVEKAWIASVPGHCIDDVSFMIGCTVTNVIIDFIILTLPFPLLWNLKVRGDRKVALFLLFGLGYSVIVISITRMSIVLKVGNAMNTDPTWTLVTPQILACVEPSVALMGACLPSIYDLARRQLRSNFPSLFNKSSNSNFAASLGIRKRGPKGRDANANSNSGDASFDQKATDEEHGIERAEPTQTRQSFFEPIEVRLSRIQPIEIRSWLRRSVGQDGVENGRAAASEAKSRSVPLEES